MTTSGLKALIPISLRFVTQTTATAPGCSYSVYFIDSILGTTTLIYNGNAVSGASNPAYIELEIGSIATDAT